MIWFCFVECILHNQLDFICNPFFYAQKSHVVSNAELNDSYFQHLDNFIGSLPKTEPEHTEEHSNKCVDHQETDESHLMSFLESLQSRFCELKLNQSKK